MSWQLASFVIIGAVLVGGFAWYERSRPTSQVVALVAALAALGVAGRLAFAALPNVVATTDIVIFAGYALGPAPGFAVGALSGLVSNFWLGQGPWTPWQMAGWGLCGFFGATLAARGRQVGRLELAAACGLAGIAYGALLNFSYMATYGGDLSLGRYLALEARAIPFDAAHAIGNMALALVAGPAMIRSLLRFRQRFEWRTATAVSVLAAALVIPLLGPTVARAADAPARASESAAHTSGTGAAASGTGAATSWLVSTQNPDGGWGASPGDSSSIEPTCWAMLALEAAGQNPLDVSSNGKTGLDFMEANLDRLGTSGDFARTILAIEGARLNAHSFGGRNLVAALVKRRRADGSFEGWPGTTAFAVMALRQAGATAGLDPSLSWLASAQNADGGWGDVPGSPSTADGTGAVMEAMPGGAAAQRGLAYLQQVQLPDGGFALGQGGPANSQSTAWAVQGIIAAGGDPGSPGPGGRSAADYLAARQTADGHYRYSASSDQTSIWVTAEVLPALLGEAFPVSAPASHGPAASAPSFNAGQPSTPTETESPSSESEFLESFEESGSSPASPSGYPETPPASTIPTSPAAPSPGHVPPAALPGASDGKPPAGEVEAEPAAEPFTLSEKDPPQPWTPLGVGLGAAGLALGGVLLLGRRFGW